MANMKQNKPKQQTPSQQSNSMGSDTRKAKKVSGFSQLSQQWDKQ